MVYNSPFFLQTFWIRHLVTLETNIHTFLSINGKKNKTRKSMEIATFKEKSRILSVLTFDHFNLNILS